MEQISQREIDVNNTLEVYYYCNDLVKAQQITQWLEMYGEDLKQKSIEFGQPLGIFLLLEYGELHLKPAELLKLSTNYIKRALEFDSDRKKDKNQYSNYDTDLFVQYIELLKLNPIDFNLLERSFHSYIDYCFVYANQNPQIGVYKRWVLEED